MGRVKRHNECGLVVGQLGFHNTAPPGVIPKVRVLKTRYFGMTPAGRNH